MSGSEDSTRQSSSQGRRRLWEGATAAALLVTVTAFTVALPRFFTPIAAIENWISDLVTVFATPPEEPSPQVVVLTLTEDTLAQFPYRSPVDRSFLAGLIRTAGAAGAKAIGFDVLLDQPTEPAKDADLAAAFREARLPVVVAWGDQRAGLTEAQSAFLAEYTQPVRTGLANLLKDDVDGTVRRTLPREAERPGLPGALALAAGAGIPQGAEPIRYVRGPDGVTPAIATFPSHLAAMLPAAWLKDKVILVGSDLPQEDRHRTPFAAAFGNRAGTIPGVFIHAFALAQFLQGRSRPVWTLEDEIALAGVMALGGVMMASLSLPVVLSAATGVAILALPWVGGMALASQGGPAPAPLAPTLAFILAAGLGAAVVGRRAQADKRFVEGAFQRYVSPAVLSQIQADPSRLRLGGERRDVTYIFTDLAGFTTFAESLPPDAVASLLNSYLDGMSALILQFEGTIDKYIGDAVVALFGAPVAHEDDPDRAVACALAMDAFASQFKAAQGDNGFGITRIGVNTGPVVVGNFGGTARFDYTAIGDTVNTASRLEGVNKYLGTRIAVGGETAARCKAHRFLPVAEIVLKGKHQGLPVFTPIVDQDSAEFIAAYSAAHALMAAESADALPAFAALVERWPDHPLAVLHHRRLREGQRGASLHMDDK